MEVVPEFLNNVGGDMLKQENARGGKYSMAFFGYFSMAENGEI
jgi:hypothetical protein